MDERLAQAIEATRAGQKKEAQLQLTRLLRDDPASVQGWYLLSLLVDSGEKQAAFLNKVVALDPTHEKARQRLSRLQSSPLPDTAALADAPVAPPETDLEAQETGESVPAWLVESGDAEIMTPPVQEEEDTGKQNYPPVVEEVPSWLETRDDDWVMEEPPTQISIPKPETNLDATVVSPSPAPGEKEETGKPIPAAAPLKEPAARHQQKGKAATQTNTLNLAILVLIVLALLIAFLLVRELLF